MDDSAIPFDVRHIQPLAEQAGLLISFIGRAGFYKQLSGFLRHRADIDSMVMLVYHRHQSPVVLHEELAPLDRQALYGRYFEGAYLLSPFYLQWLENQAEAELYRLHDIAPDGFFDSIYYTDYYMRSGLRDEMAYLIPIDNDSAVLASLGRTEHFEVYSDLERHELNAVKSIIDGCVKLHASLLIESPKVRLKKQLSDYFSSFGAQTLTPQERRVAQMMLRGHSSKSCARELGISPTTERVHRRNIYAKLNISSQAELFTFFFDTLANEDDFPDTDNP